MPAARWARPCSSGTSSWTGPGGPRAATPSRGASWAPHFTTDQVERALARQGAAGRRFDDEAELLDHVAGLLAEGKVVGWFQGRMEFGPRALGRAASWATPARRPCRRP